MRICVTIFVILISTFIVNASILDPVIENVVHLQASKPPSGVPGIWKKKTIWKPRWVKEWKSAKVMKPVWRKVWSPIQIKEWMPVPKPPPGWDSISTPLAPVKHVLKEDPPSHASSSPPLPLWDPIPYPESQQPPPPPPPSLHQYHHHHHPDNNCGHVGCDKPSLAFNHQQISEIISTNRYKKAPDYSQGVEFSETVNHLTRLPPNANNWRPPQPAPVNFQQFNSFNNFPDLPPFLVPPKYQPFPVNNPNFQFRNQNFNPINHQKFHPPLSLNSRPHANVDITQSPGFEVNQNQNLGQNQWTPLRQQNDVRHTHHPPNVHQPTEQPYKFEIPQTTIPPKTNTKDSNSIHENKVASNPDAEMSSKPGFQTHKPHSHIRPDFIQQADLVGEYHYSEFDLPRKPTPQHRQPEVNAEQKGSGKPKPPPPKPPQPIHHAPKGGHRVPEPRPKPQSPPPKPTHPTHQNAPKGGQRVPDSRPKPHSPPPKPSHPTQQNAPKGGYKMPDSRPKPQLPTVESKPRQIRKDGIKPQPNASTETGPRPQPQHSLPTLPNSSNFQLQKAVIKEIPSAYQTSNQILGSSLSDEQFPPYPVKASSPPFSIPANHRFAPLPDYKSPEKISSSLLNLNSSTKLIPMTPDNNWVLPNLKQNPTTDKNLRLHVVYPEPQEQYLTSQQYPEVVTLETNQITNNYYNDTDALYESSTTETTTPLSAIPSSSLSDETSGTETVTKSSVFIVTPIYPNKS